MNSRARISALALASALFAVNASAADDIESLREQIRQQQEIIAQQQGQLDRQEQTLKSMSAALDRLAGAPVAQQARADAAPDTPARPVNLLSRDVVGDVNNRALTEGEFPGAIAIPGTQNVSLAIGGFIKTVAILDTRSETSGAAFLPAFLGTRRDDKNGAFNIDSTLSRMMVDARAPAPGDGQLRGYLEWDFNDGNDGDVNLKVRHAYGSWKTRYGTLTAGHTWSTMMDIKILPEGLTEPTVSGAIFNRQPLIAWSQPVQNFTLHAALEDPSSDDIFSSVSDAELSETKRPDIILGAEYDTSALHVRLNAISRELNTQLPNGDQDSENAWGVALTGYLNLPNEDRWTWNGVYGEGLGRYLLGIQSQAAGFIEPSGDKTQLRDNWGAMTAYRHNWSDTLRTTAMVGYAKSEPLDFQPGDTFESSIYSSINLMWQVLPYMTVGVEYAYGENKTKDSDSLNNHRVAMGFQFY